MKKEVSTNTSKFGNNNIPQLKEIKKPNNNHHLSNTNIVPKNKNMAIKYTSIISKNLKKYKTTKKTYNKYIINLIIFDQKRHIVSEFKNYLLWDETSEFLKRFYNQENHMNVYPIFPNIIVKHQQNGGSNVHQRHFPHLIFLQLLHLYKVCLVLQKYIFI